MVPTALLLYYPGKEQLGGRQICPKVQDLLGENDLEKNRRKKNNLNFIIIFIIIMGKIIDHLNDSHIHSSSAIL
jgi:hypothetical protein